MAQRDDDDWTAQMPVRRYNQGPYEDYGWGPGESVLLPFRDPSVHVMPYERVGQQPFSDNDFEPDGDRPGRDGMRGGAIQGGPPRPMGYSHGQGYMQRSLYDTWRMDPGPYTGVGPKGYQRSDPRIYEDVCERLMQFHRLDVSDVEVKVEEGEVTLTGTVHSRAARRLVEDIVDSVNGVRDVHNLLRVAVH